MCDHVSLTLLVLWYLPSWASGLHLSLTLTFFLPFLYLASSPIFILPGYRSNQFYSLTKESSTYAQCTKGFLPQTEAVTLLFSSFPINLLCEFWCVVWLCDIPCLWALILIGLNSKMHTTLTLTENGYKLFTYAHITFPCNYSSLRKACILP